LQNFVLEMLPNRCQKAEVSTRKSTNATTSLCQYLFPKKKTLPIFESFIPHLAAAYIFFFFFFEIRLLTSRATTKIQGERKKLKQQFQTMT